MTTPTQDVSGLVEKLRKLEHRFLNEAHQEHVGETIRSAVCCIADFESALQAASEREARLVAENERFRRALKKIATVDMGGGFLGAGACRKVALQALGREG